MQAASFKVGCVAGSEDGAARAGDGGDLRVQLCDSPTFGAALGGYFRKSPRGLFVEWQDAPRKVLHKHRLSFQEQTVATLSFGKNFDSVKNFRHGHRGGEEFS